MTEDNRVDRDDLEPAKHGPAAPRAGRRTWAGCARTSPPPCSRCPTTCGAAATLPSGWTPIELLSHVLHMEQRWFVWGFLGEQVDDPWGDWTVDEPWDSDDGPVGGRARRHGRRAGRSADGDRGADHADPARLPARRHRVARWPVRRRPTQPGVDLLPRAGGVRPARRSARRRPRGPGNRQKTRPPSGPKPSARSGSSGTGRGAPPRARGSPRSAPAGVTTRTLGRRSPQPGHTTSTARQGFGNGLDSGRAARLRHRLPAGLRGPLRRGRRRSGRRARLRATDEARRAARAADRPRDDVGGHRPAGPHGDRGRRRAGSVHRSPGRPGHCAHAGLRARHPGVRRVLARRARGRGGRHGCGRRGTSWSRPTRAARRSTSRGTTPPAPASTDRWSTSPPPRDRLAVVGRARCSTPRPSRTASARRRPAPGGWRAASPRSAPS